MGDIFRKVKVCGLTDAGGVLGCQTVEALLDSGASTTVVSAELAKKLGGKMLAGMDAHIEGRDVPLKLIGLKMEAPGCRVSALTAAVDTSLVARAGAAPDGSTTHVIVGHDYLQRGFARLQFSPKSAEQTVSCGISTKRKQ